MLLEYQKHLRKKINDLHAEMMCVPFGPQTRSDKLINYEYRKKITSILQSHGYPTELVDELTTPVRDHEATLFRIASEVVATANGTTPADIFREYRTYYNFVLILIIAVVVLVTIANHQIPLPFADAPSVDELFPVPEVRV